MADAITIRSGNKGLTVKVNLWALEKYIDDFDAESARLWIKGQVQHGTTKEAKLFNDAGELLSILGRWNVQQFKKLKGERKKA